MKDNIYLLEGKQELLDEIKELWQKLNKHHFDNSKHFKKRFQEFTFDNRKKSLLEKAVQGDMQVLLAKDKESNLNIGYSVSTVTSEGVGELESLFVEKEYRKQNVGEMLVKASVKWLEAKAPKEITITVAGGNERVLDFYKKFGFYTASTKLAKAEEATNLWETNYKDFVISADKTMIKIDDIVAMLNKSYWAAGRSRDRIIKSIENSLCFGVYHKDKQIGFARIVTDYVTNAYLCDVIIDEEYRGQGIGKSLMDFIMSWQELQEVKSWSLMTKDAHGLYEKYGFGNMKEPQRFMIKRVEGKY